MNLEFMVVIGLMALSLGYVSNWAYEEMKRVWKLYVMGKELEERWDRDVIDIMTGENDE